MLTCVSFSRDFPMITPSSGPHLANAAASRTAATCLLLNGALALICLFMIGCGKLSVGGGDVAELAKEWPPYQPPAMADTFPATPPYGGAVPLDQEIGSGRPRATELPRPPILPIEQWDLEKTAIDSLGRIGAAAVPALVQSLQHPDAEKRAQAANVLGRIGPDAQAAVPDLVRALYDPDLEVRKAATRALGQIGPAAEEAVAPLLEIIEQRSPLQDDTAR